MVEVAPLIAVNVVAPLVLTSHSTVSAPLGLELATVKVAVAPALTVWLAGSVVTWSTVSVAADVVAAVPTLLLKTASYSLPFSAPVAVKL